LTYQTWVMTVTHPSQPAGCGSGAVRLKSGRSRSTGSVTAVVAREGAHGKDARTPAPAARSGLPLRVRLARRLGHLAETVSRSTRLGSGGVIGGRVLLALAPRAFR